MMQKKTTIKMTPTQASVYISSWSVDVHLTLTQVSGPETDEVEVDVPMSIARQLHDQLGKELEEHDAKVKENEKETV